MISKELIMKILDYPNGVESVCQDGDGILILSATKLHDDIYDIYNLAHRCKEWANDSEYFRIETGKPYSYNNDAKYWYHIYDGHMSCEKVHNGFEKTEPEAIFKACEWLLNEGKR